MEKLSYSINDETIVELFGLQSFTNANSALLELVKNSFDAGSLNLNIIFREDALILKDNGSGMNQNDIKKYWMVIGESHKKSDISLIDDDHNLRILSGSKGIGRFALSRLGGKVRLYSKRNNEKCILWKTDWKDSYVTESNTLTEKGTQIIISNLREKWTKRKIEEFCSYLETAYKDKSMSINVYIDNEKINSKQKEQSSWKIEPHFSAPVPGKNCKSCIQLEYSGTTLSVKIRSDEFNDKAKNYCKDDIHAYSSTVDMLDELKDKDTIGDYSPEDEYELQEKLIGLGSFSSVFYFNFDASSKDKDDFLYKYSQTQENVRGGIVLYRNSFTISSFDGKKDWLGLGKRSRRSPAAASHPTGAWRVKTNQLSGYVDIDKSINNQLKDLANRQGIEENDYFQLFVEIITFGIQVFERYRQGIIRDINKKNKNTELPKSTVLDEVLKSPSKFKSLNDSEIKSLAEELKNIKESEEKLSRTKEQDEKRYKYDIRILNVLATNGLKVSSMAHDLSNDKSSINSWYKYTVDALKKYGMWDDLNLPERREKAYLDVPLMLEKASRVSKKISSFINSLLDKIEKNKFDIDIVNVEELLNHIAKSWKNDYYWLSINISVKENIEVFLSYDSLQVIFDNLILNSIQQNAERNKLNIIIHAEVKDEKLFFSYQDDGVGLAKKYENDPTRILEVHETTRKNGHGLGMWIVRNTISLFNGDIIKIGGSQGFIFEFFIGKLSCQ